MKRGNDEITVDMMFRHEIKKMFQRYLYTREERAALERLIRNGGGDISEFLWVVMSGTFLNISRLEWSMGGLDKKLDRYINKINRETEVIHASQVLHKRSDIIDIDLTYSGLDIVDHDKPGKYGNLHDVVNDKVVDMVTEFYHYLGLDNIKPHTECFAFVLTRAGLMTVTARS